MLLPTFLAAIQTAWPFWNKLLGAETKKKQFSVKTEVYREESYRGLLIRKE